MILRNPLNFISQFFINISKKLKNIYLNSNYYDKKISKISNNDLIYRPSPHLLSSLIKYQTKKINVDSISTENLWDNKNLNSKNFRKLKLKRNKVIGNKAVFGNMPDWNPAEIIGVKPNPLSMDLYKYLITNSVWSIQRKQYGYRHIKKHP